MEARAAESGHGTVEQYVQALLRDDVDGFDEAHPGGPDHLAIGTADRLEALLLRRVQEGGPSIEATPELWQGLKDRTRGS